MTTNNYTEKKHSLVKKAVDDKKSITIINDRSNNKPLAFDSQRKYDNYKKRLTTKKQAS